MTEKKVELETFLEGKIILVKVGTDERPASPQDIQEVRGLMEELLKGTVGSRVLVTHHAFDMSIIDIPQNISENKILGMS